MARPPGVRKDGLPLAGACAVDDAVAVRACAREVVERRVRVIPVERRVEVDGCRDDRAAVVDAELAELVVAAQRSRAKAVGSTPVRRVEPVRTRLRVAALVVAV